MLINDEEVFLIPYSSSKEQEILYAPRRSYVALISRELGTALKQDALSDLASSFITRLRQRPNIPIEEILNETRNANPILSVALTNDCNLRCRYCHARAGEDNRHASMTTEMIDSLLGAYFKQLRVPKELMRKTSTVDIKIMGGGEPTFVFPQLQFLVEKARALAADKGCRCLFTMPTNGVYGDQIREFITANIQNISLSFDGQAHIQDLHRPLYSGKPSFQFVFETANYFKKRRASFAIRTTVSDYSLPYLEETVKFFTENYPGISVSFEPLIPVGRALTDKTVGAPDQKLMAEAFVRILGDAHEKGYNIHNSASSEYDILRPVFCSSVAVPNWTVLVDGSIFCCDRDNAPEEFLLGRFDFKKSEFFIDDLKVKAIRKMTVFNYPECSNCFCKYHCAGDCPDRRLSNKLDCESIKKVGLHILESKIHKKQESKPHENT